MSGQSHASARWPLVLAVALGALLLAPSVPAKTKTPKEKTPKEKKEKSERGGGHAGGGGKGWIELTEDVPKPVPNPIQRKDGMILFQRSLLVRIYQSSRPRPEEMVSGVELQATRGAYEAAQVAVYALRDLQNLRVSVSDLYDKEGHTIPASQVTVRMVRFYGAQLAVGHQGLLGVVPKTLEIAVPLAVANETVRPYWITVHVPPDQAGGTYHGTVTFEHAAGSRAIDLTVEVIPVTLDEPDIVYGPLCVNVLSNLWKGSRAGKVGNDITGPTPLQVGDIVFRDQREHGANMISLRSGAQYLEQNGHPHLPDLDAAIEMYKKYGFNKPLIYCAGQLLKTNKINRSANYKEFDPNVHVPMAKRVAEYYTKRFHDEGLPGVAFMPVEEPNLRSGIGMLDPPDTRRRLATTLIGAMKESGATTAMTCTPQSVTAAIDDCDYWIVAYRKFDPKLYDLAKQHHAQLGVYANATMMGQGTYFTRFMFGYFMYGSGLKAMTPWTYPVQPKRFPVNVDNRGEGGLNVSDEFIGLDGKPIPTVQWELSREGIDDARYLVTIERLSAKARTLDTPAAKAAVADADQLLDGVRSSVDRDVRHYKFEDPKTMEPQPQDGWDAAKFDATRKQSVAVLKKLLAALPSGHADAH